MAKFDGFLLLSDADNTLIMDNKISRKSLEKIKYFTENGGLFTVVTGRGLAAAVEPWEMSCSNTYLACFNGGMIYDVKNEKILFQNAVSDEDKKFFCKAAEIFSEVGVEIHVGKTVYIIRPTKEVIWHCEYESVPLNFASFEDIIDLTWNKCQLVLDIEKPELNEKIAEYLKKNPLKDGDFVKTSIGDGIHYFYEIHPSGSNKGEAVKNLKKFTGAEKIFTIGDYFNDVEMFELSDKSACVKDSPEGVKEAADYVVCSCLDGAVGEFIDIIEKTEAAQ